jgi:hypothetical protein
LKRVQGRGLRNRPAPNRDARLFVIAVEGEESGAECAYFTGLEGLPFFERKRVKLVPLAAEAELHHSAPGHVLERLDEHCRTYQVRESFDELWLVFDVDSWPSASLSRVAKDALQRRYKLAISSPCFEVWLLLHETYDLQFLMQHEPRQRSSATKRRLGELRAQGLPPITIEKIWVARQRARELDRKPGERWPTSTGTHMYKLIDALADAGALQRLS